MHMNVIVQYRRDIHFYQIIFCSDIAVSKWNKKRHTEKSITNNFVSSFETMLPQTHPDHFLKLSFVSIHLSRFDELRGPPYIFHKFSKTLNLA